MANLGKRALFEPIRSIDSATFTGSYQLIGSTGLSHPSVLFKIVNNSGVLVTVSFDGINDHDVLPANTFTLYDVGSDKQDSSGLLSVAQGTKFYAKGSASTGLVYLISMYQGG